MSAGLGGRRWLSCALAAAVVFAGEAGVSLASAAPHGNQEHAAQGHSEHGSAAEHGGGHGEHHQEFNWYHGLIGAREGVEPSLLWRAPGSPPPFAALLFNTALLAFVLVRFGRKPVVEGLRVRRERLSSSATEAARMQAEAEAELAKYREKLEGLGAEIERVRKETAEAAEADRRRVLQEAAERRQRLEGEARRLIQQEMTAARDELVRATAQAALNSARTLLKQQITPQDDLRLCDAYLDRGVFGGQRPSGAPRAGRAPGGLA